MSALTVEQRGDMAEALLPEAAGLIVDVHEGSADDIKSRLAGLSRHELEGLAVMLAALADPDRGLVDALSWVDFDEHGEPLGPRAWQSPRSLRDHAPEQVEEVDADYVDEVAVAKFMRGLPVEVTDAEFLDAVKRCVALDMTLADVNQLRGWPANTAQNRVNRLRKQWQRSGREFPSLAQPSLRVLTEDEVVTIRERSEAGDTDLLIAMSFDVSQKTVGEVCRGKRYPQYGGPIRAAKQVQYLKGTREFMCGHANKSRAARRNNEMEKVA